VRTEDRSRFYDRYVSTHLLHRKGAASLAVFGQKARAFQQALGRLLPRDRAAVILDAGCGDGALVWWLQQQGYQSVEGVDISREQVEVAAKLGVHNVWESDLKEYLLARPARYDMVICRDIIEHLPREEIIETLDACRGGLRAEGQVLIQVPNAESPFFGRIRYGDFTHEMAFSESSLAQLLQVIGFRNVRCYPTPPPIVSFRSLLRLPLWKAVELFYKLLLFAELGRGRRIVTQGIIALADR
jgi:2-polyprenyl-3-methyl-5-hydroxy-6-metoxy-1,4-benzoquinol methylase